MQNLFLTSKRGAYPILKKLFATIKNLGVDIKPSDNLVIIYPILGKSTHWS